MATQKDIEYKQVLLAHEEGDFDEKPYSDRRRPRSWWFSFSFWFWSWLCITITFFATRAYYVDELPHRSPIERLAATDAYSPLYEGADIRFDYTTLGGDLWGNETNIWRQDPSPAVDEAWDSISESRYMLVTKDDLIKMGKPVEGAVHWSEDPTGNMYLAEFHVYHILHCLNEMRKNAFVNFDYYFGGGRPLNPIHWDHFTHCLDILRQELICSPSFHVTRMVWQEDQTLPFPEFRTNRMCTRWNDFEAWTRQNEVAREDVREMSLTTTKPPDAIERPAPPEAKELLHRNSEWLMKMIAEGYDIHLG